MTTWYNNNKKLYCAISINCNNFHSWTKYHLCLLAQIISDDYYKYVSCNNPRETWFGNGTQVKPCRSGLRMDGWPTANIVLKVHTLFFLFFFFFFAYYVVLLLTVYWKADLALFRRPDLEKDKNKEQIWPGAVRLKIIMEIPSSVRSYWSLNKAYNDRIRQETLVHGHWSREESSTLSSVSLPIKQENSRKIPSCCF